MIFGMEVADICLLLIDADSRFLDTITSYLACIPMWSEMLTTRVAPVDFIKTPFPWMYQRLQCTIKVFTIIRVFKL